MQILYDLVTVKGECGAQNVTGESREGSAAREDPKPGNLPYAGTGASAPDHEALVVPSSLRGSCRDKCALPCGGFFPACLFDPRRENQRRHNMKRRIATLLLSAALIGTLIGCGGTAENAAPSGETADTAESAADVIEESAAESAPVTDESGEADAEDEENYETGDASLDDPGNQDEIGENEILVVSFGTSFNDSRRLTIGSIENAIREAFPDWSVRRAFTSQIIIDHVNKRDSVKIDNVKEALDRAVDNGVKNLVVQPTHLMAGLEYHDLEEEVMSYADAFESITMGENLLAEDGDFEEVAKIITARTAEYDDGETAICFMGHGTEAESNAVYAKMQEVLTADGFENYFVGTVEATPSLEDVMAAVGEGEYKRVVLMPLMVVAGDHANNDMAGDEEDSWKSQFEAEGYSVECVLEGLGQQPEIQQLYVEHLQKFVESALAE